jgi:hypothetical protein
MSHTHRERALTAEVDRRVERKTLAEIGKKLGKHVLEEIATIVKPDTILLWHHPPRSPNLNVYAERWVRSVK